MIKELGDLPAGVIGFEASGTMRAEDYRDVILPALERASAAGEVMTTLFGWMTPGQVRHFPLAQRDEAIAWAAS